MNHQCSPFGTNANNQTLGTRQQECKEKTDGAMQNTVNAVGKTTVDTVDCAYCANVYQGADLKRRCRMDGLDVFSDTSKAGAYGCRAYRREPGSDDEVRYWLCE